MKCIIIEDLPIALKGMTRLVHQRPELHLVGAYESAEAAIEGISSEAVDLAFVDISLGGMSGMELARRLSPTTMVIFTTAYSEYAVESYDVDAVDYLVKPIDPAKFDRAVDKAIERARSKRAEIRMRDQMENSETECITIKSDRRFVRLRYDDILYVEGIKNNVIFHLENETVVTRATLGSVAEELPASRFIRINKSYIANKRRITSFTMSDVVIGTFEISIGSKYRAPLLDFLLK